MTALWQAAPAERFRLHAWPDEGTGILFDRVSGDTHAIGELGLLLIELVSAGPIDDTALRAGVLEHLESDAEAPDTAIGEALHSLQVIGILVRR